MVAFLSSAALLGWTPHSQGRQDIRLWRLLHHVLGIKSGTFVEFGFPARNGSNTEGLLKRGGWTGLRLDGSNNDAAANCHAEWIKSTNIVSLFDKYRVQHEVDYVSIDIDSADIWVFEALVSSSYRPKALTSSAPRPNRRAPRTSSDQRYQRWPLPQHDD